MSKSKPLNIATVAAGLKAIADESRRRQMAAMASQKPRHRPVGKSDPSPGQEIAIRIMEDMK